MCDSLTFDEKVYVACLIAPWHDPVVTNVREVNGRTVTSRYDAITWASWDSVEVTL